MAFHRLNILISVWFCLNCWPWSRTDSTFFIHYSCWSWPFTDSTFFYYGHGQIPTHFFPSLAMLFHRLIFHMIFFWTVGHGLSPTQHSYFGLILFKLLAMVIFSSLAMVFHRLNFHMIFFNCFFSNVFFSTQLFISVLAMVLNRLNKSFSYFPFSFFLFITNLVMSSTQRKFSDTTRLPATRLRRFR